MELMQSPVPLYYQLKGAIKHKIEVNDWPKGEAIPGERELEKMFNLSRTPIRQAIGELVTEGILERKHGKGTFVASQKIKQTTTKLVGLVEGMYQRQMDPKIVLQEFAIKSAPFEVTEAMHLPEHAQMIFVRRQVHVKDCTIIVDENYCNLNLSDYITKESVLNRTIFDVLEKNGIQIKKGTQNFSAVSLSAEYARLLHVKTGAPALVVKTLLLNTRDLPLQYSVSYCRADRYEHEILLSR